jgi:hypothetical protein
MCLVQAWGIAGMEEAAKANKDAIAKLPNRLLVDFNVDGRNCSHIEIHTRNIETAKAIRIKHCAMGLDYHTFFDKTTMGERDFESWSKAVGASYTMGEQRCTRRG